ncbi:MAG TPA: hypothetical protein PK264_20190 [Hyphomicrobiaceae bacterium]|nr:hypothetical protein [Hyphomicrobiaceae bacterium]
MAEDDTRRRSPLNERKERLASALRENLQKRKQQARLRARSDDECLGDGAASRGRNTDHGKDA